MNPISPAPAAPPGAGRSSGPGRPAVGGGDGFVDLMTTLLGPAGAPDGGPDRTVDGRGGSGQATDEPTPGLPVEDAGATDAPAEEAVATPGGSVGNSIAATSAPVPPVTGGPGTPVTPAPVPPAATTAQKGTDGAPGTGPSTGTPSGPALPGTTTGTTTGAPAGATTWSGPTTGGVPVVGRVTTGGSTTVGSTSVGPTTVGPPTTGQAASRASASVPSGTQPAIPATPGQVSHRGSGEAPATVVTPTVPGTPAVPADAAESRAVAHALAEVAREVAAGGIPAVEGPAGAGAATTGQAGSVAGTTTGADAQLTQVGRQVAATLVRFVESSAAGPTTQRVTLQLHPVDLGEVRATLTLRDGAVRVTLTAGEAARELLRRDHPLLQQVLERTGAERVEIAVRALPGTALREGAESAFQLPTGTATDPGTGRGTGAGADQAGHREERSGAPTDRPGQTGRAAPAGPSGPDLPLPAARPAHVGLDVTV